MALQKFFSIYQVTKELNDTSTGRDMLMGLSAVAAGMHQHERAAKLYGAFQGSAETTNFRYFGFYETEFERHLKIAKDQLGEAKFERLANDGRLLTIDQAIKYALETRSG